MGSFPRDEDVFMLSVPRNKSITTENNQNDMLEIQYLQVTTCMCHNMQDVVLVEVTRKTIPFEH